MDWKERAYRLSAMARMLVDLYQAAEYCGMLHGDIEDGAEDRLMEECDHFRDVINKLMEVEDGGGPDNRGEQAGEEAQ